MNDGSKEERLCSYCLDIFPIREDEQTRTIQHHPNAEELLSTAGSCRLCKIISKCWSLKSLQRRFPDITEDKFKDISLSLELNAPRVATTGVSWALLEVSLVTPEHRERMISGLSITTCNLRGAIAKHPSWNTMMPSITDNHVTIRKWLMECESEHVSCIPPDVEPPKRLIEVGSSGSPVRLVNTNNGFKEHWRYATLSHCWGSYRPLTLTVENEESFMNQIPWESLPQSFREAIDIARATKIPYLWIDSLCIAQDDEVEWRQEALRMRDVYFGSTLAICASDSRNSLAGCFLQKDEGPLVPISEELMRFSTVLPKGENAVSIRVLRGDERTRRERCALAVRGWTLQEQVLPNRVIYCLRTGIQWHCRCAHLTHSGVSFNESYWNSLKVKALPLLASPTELHEVWCRWMEDYSTRDLTFPRDRFAALAGITQEYSDRSGHRHLLGSWEQTLTNDLLWMRCDKVEKPCNMLPGVPSWSWLSRCKGISFEFRDKLYPRNWIEDIDQVEVVEANVSWTGVPLLSNIAQSRLVLKGSVKVLKLLISPPASGVFHIDFDGTFDDEKERGSTAYPCLLMRTRTCIQDNGFISSKEIFLILEQSPVGNSTDTYRRIGLGVFRGARSQFEGSCRKQVILI